MFLQLTKSLLRIVIVVVMLLLAYLFFFQSRMIYFPRHTSEATVSAFLQSGGKRVEYETTHGRETAWLLPAAGQRVPERLWIVCAGNASEALSLADLQDYSGLSQDAFLFVDYPGYGVSPGTPNPPAIQENIRQAVPVAARATGFPMAEIGTRGIVFGHSLGAAAALLGVEEFHLRRAVLLAPFTSAMEMTSIVVRAPLGWLVRHRYDNRARLTGLQKRGGHVWIFHGSDDEAIPAIMGRTLARELGSTATYMEVAGGTHNDLLEKAPKEIQQAMRDARN
ncbi:MAG: alpha/beta fold hydrolase [Chthoniobacterales bacterium]